jgi:uncharacterized protein (TIGR02271 family)
MDSAIQRAEVRRLSNGGGLTHGDSCVGRELVDRMGHLVGRIEALFTDDIARIEWAEVRVGLCSTRRFMVPMAQARPLGERLRVPFDKERIVRSPRHELDGAAGQATEPRLLRHYGEEPSTVPVERAPESGVAHGSDTEAAAAAKEPPSNESVQVGRQERDSTTVGAMTRSEEELRIRTVRRVRGRVRVCKYVVTEEVQYTIPLRREEIRIENMPIGDEDIAPGAGGSAALSGEHEIVLHEEVPVVDKRVVPRERVRVSKEAQIEEAQVTEELRRERIEAEGDLEP